jgi:hypothetical protein
MTRSRWSLRDAMHDCACRGLYAPILSNVWPSVGGGRPTAEGEEEEHWARVLADRRLVAL